MSEEGKKSGLHIHFGGLIVIIIILLLLFRVDLKTVTNSPQFQKNVSFVKEQAVTVWDKYLKEPLINGWNGLFNNLVDKGVEELKEGLKNGIDANFMKLEQPGINLGAPMSNTSNNQDNIN